MLRGLWVLKKNVLVFTITLRHQMLIILSLVFYFFGLNGSLPMVCGGLSLTLTSPITPHMLNTWNTVNVLFLIFLIINLNDNISLC